MDRSAFRLQYLAALALACLLTAAWCVADWGNLSALRLPDTDDAMRLAQVRDWIAGQGFADVSQHRLADGLAMHWSRIGDVVPAAIILTLRPMMGQHAAEIVAVVAWPLAQFVALLAIVASITRVVAPRAAGTAIVLAALAYPTSALFLPGRIDHHALQILLVLGQIRALLAPPDWRSGAVAGALVALGAAIGLETLPFAVVTGAIVLLGWWHGAGARQAGFGLALAGGLLLLWPIAARGGVCDTVAPLLPTAIAAALALAALARVERHRLVWLGAAGVALAVIGWPAVQPCLSGPYGAVDPLVARLWLANVSEAQPLFAVSFANALAFAALATAGLVAGSVMAWRARGGWLVLVAYQLAGAVLTLSQLRGVYLGTVLAVIPIAALIAEQRARGRLLNVLGLWVAGAGLTWPLIAAATAPARKGADAPSCSSPSALATLGALPPGRMMAGIDAGAYLVAGTPHTAIAAPYHRNNAGNAAMYRFFLGPPAAAHAIATRWRVDYVVRCPGDFGTVRAPSGSIGAGTVPGWLTPLTRPGAVPAIYRVDRRLSDPARAR
ncbi:hypothetical protein M9980_00245 [Sphingomonas donggukensis]|uniref:Glycosyltransferase RgtA/B/C/D-like domain-containing protein n=1 Tax=Sphingomonas donggukensis TaxID=2949093 RepID=A0ABY4TTH4_9SPHN|nr:hypothetical protein [Sphingomonas donggukensis]URW75704.1 hypothetical protein M9980_00245 [Sphingomonas donggukensis]